MAKSQSIPTTPKVTVGGQERELRFTVNTLVTIEEKTGRNVLADPFPLKFSATDVRLYAWAALQHETPAPSVEEVGSWIKPCNVAAVLTALGQAYAAGVARGA